MKKRKPIIICGPTASGKSAYALTLAQQIGGVILNGDSMQVYQELPILTAQPTVQEQKAVPHRLYSVLAGNDPCSVARWHQLVLHEIQSCEEQGLVPIVVGGTGLYLSALFNGLSHVPDIDPCIRTQARALYDELGAEEFYQALLKLDPVMAAQLNPNDQQRLVRAYEVKLSTGESLAYWHKKNGQLNGLACEIKIINRPREILHQRATIRFEQMLEEGAIKEVESLIEQKIDLSLPVMKALGVPELMAYLEERLSLSEAKEKSIISTRQYIKRQATWFRHQLKQAESINL